MWTIVDRNNQVIFGKFEGVRILSGCWNWFGF